MRGLGAWHPAGLSAVQVSGHHKPPGPSSFQNSRNRVPMPYKCCNALGGFGDLMLGSHSFMCLGPTGQIRGNGSIMAAVASSFKYGSATAWEPDLKTLTYYNFLEF